MLFIEKTKGQLAYLYRLKVNLEKRLRLMPEGNLRRKKTRNKIYYYVKDGIRQSSLYNLPELRDIYIEKQWIEGQLKVIKRRTEALLQGRVFQEQVRSSGCNGSGFSWTGI